MRMRLLGAALAFCFAVSCSNAPASSGTSATGSIGVSHDDQYLFVADADLDAVFVVNTKNQTVSKIAVGRQPEKVVVASDDTAYVTNRMSRSVSVVRIGDERESARIDVAVEPVGLALSADEKTLYVVNAASLNDTEYGTLMAVDTKTLQVKWEMAVGHEPRGIALLPNGRAAIGLFKDGDLVEVDLATHKVVKGGTGLYEQLNRSALGLEQPDDAFGPTKEPFPRRGVAGGSPDFPTNGPRTSRPRGFDALVASPDGTHLYATSLISTDQLLRTRAPDESFGVSHANEQDVDPKNDFEQFDNFNGGEGYGASSCGGSAVAASALLTFDEKLQPQVDDVQRCGQVTSDRPAMFEVSSSFGLPIQGPSAATIDPSGRFLFIAHRNSNNVSIVPTMRDNNVSVAAPQNEVFIDKPVTSGRLIDVGAGPSGIVLSHDGKTAWVHNAFDHSVSALSGTDGNVGNVLTTTYASDVLPADVVDGRKLFFSAVDPRMNNPVLGIACASCHIEGREDGHVWNTTEGVRQTPSLAGRMTAQTAPFHWNGEFNNLMEFMNHTVKDRMGGNEVTQTMERQIAAFIASIPAPDNALKSTLPADVLARGQAAFEKAQCNSCHGGATLTDNSYADVGTFVTSGEVIDNMRFSPKGLNTPSLLGVGRSAPYLHDGSVLTLKERLVRGKANDKHGLTSTLSSKEIDDLVLYLKTL